MNMVLWVIATVLAAVFTATGVRMLTASKERLIASGMDSLESYSPMAIKTIGLLEVSAAAGLILPAALGIIPVMVVLAASGVMALMVGAIISHYRRRDYRMVLLNVVLLASAAAVAWGRFGPYSF